MIVQKNKILKFTRKYLKKLNLPKEDIIIISNLLVKADCAGHFSHGINRLIQYDKAIESGIININKCIEFEYKNNFLYINANHYFGQVAMHDACKKIIKKNLDLTVSSISNSAHIGRLSDYVEILANNGYVSILMSSGGGPNVAPFPVRKRLVGTNPIAIGIPISKNKNFILDFSTSSIAEGKINIHKQKKQDLPFDAIIDKLGHLTNKTHSFYDYGSIIPMGSHKGSGLNLAIELISGYLLSDNISLKKNYVDGNNSFLICFKKINLIVLTLKKCMKI